MTTTLKFGLLLPGVLGAALVARPARATTVSEEPRPNLSGAWTLNEKESEMPRPRMRDGRRGGARGGGGFGRQGGGGFGRPGGGRGGGFPGDGPSSNGRFGGQEGGFERLHERLRSLTIEHTEPVLHVLYGDQRDDTFYTDGRKVKREDERGFAEVKASWKKNRVLIERRTARGQTRETYELAPGGRRLLVTTKLSGPMGAFELRRVYDAQAEQRELAAPPGQ